MNYHGVTFTFTETMLMSLVCAMAAASLDSLEAALMERASHFQLVTQTG